MLLLLRMVTSKIKVSEGQFFYFMENSYSALDIQFSVFFKPFYHLQKLWRHDYYYRMR